MTQDSQPDGINNTLNLRARGSKLMITDELPKVICSKCSAEFELPFIFLHEITDEQFLCQHCFKSHCLCGAPGLVRVFEKNSVNFGQYACGTQIYQYPDGKTEHQPTNECKDAQIVALRMRLAKRRG